MKNNNYLYKENGSNWFQQITISTDTYSGFQIHARLQLANGFGSFDWWKTWLSASETS